MLRRPALLSVALAGILGCSDAWAGQTKLPVSGRVTAMALVGDATIVARQRADGAIRLERLTPGTPAQTLLRLPRSHDDDPRLSLAVSAQALAVSMQTSSESGASHVYVGSPAGPLREVAACQTGLLLPAVAVFGSRVAWTSGGCGQPPDAPVAASPATIVIADADPAVPPRLVALDAEALPTAILLGGPSELVGLIRPSFFSFFKSEVRRLEVGGLGETIAREDGGIVVPLGALPSGDAAFAVSQEQDDDEDGQDSHTCEVTLFVLAAQDSHRRPLSLGGCPAETDITLPGSAARISGDRVYAIVREKATGSATGTQPPPPDVAALRSVRADGSAGRLLARGSYRAPLGFTTDAAGRVGWWYRTCTGGSEIVVDDLAGPAAPTAIAACSLTVLTRTARVRGRVTTVRLRCPSGCEGQVYDRSHSLRGFSFDRGTHRLRLRLTRRERRSERLRLRFDVAQGPPRAKVIRLR